MAEALGHGFSCLPPGFLAERELLRQIHNLPFALVTVWTAVIEARQKPDESGAACLSRSERGFWKGNPESKKRISLRLMLHRH